MPFKKDESYALDQYWERKKAKERLITNQQIKKQTEGQTSQPINKLTDH